LKYVFILNDFKLRTMVADYHVRKAQQNAIYQITVDISTSNK